MPWTPASWVAGDEVYGNDPKLRADLHQRRIDYVLAVACDHHITTTAGKHGKQEAADLAAGLPARVWARLSAGGGATGSTTDHGFIDTMRAEGHTVESICPVAARTYRSWKHPDRRVADRTIADAMVVDTVRSLAWRPDPKSGEARLTAEGLYGRRKMTALLRRTTMPEVSAGAVDRGMRTLGLVGLRRDKGTRTTIPAKDGIRAGDLLDRDFTAQAPNRVWVTDFTYVRTWAGFVYVAFILDVFAQRIVAWHASTSKVTDPVMTPLRMALWQRDRDGHPTVRGELIHHSARRIQLVVATP